MIVVHKNNLMRYTILLFYLILSLQISAQTGDYKFNGSVSRHVLENYLSRAITLAEFLAVDPYGNDGKYPCKDRDVELIRNTGAKFIGRAIYRWGKEETLNNSDFLVQAKNLIDKVHEFDSDVIFQACVFEAVYGGVNNIKIPQWAFDALSLPVENRNFSYEHMLNKDGKFVNQWGQGASVPDITRTETQLWLMFLIGTYVEIGVEAIHLGQVSLMGMNDSQFKIWKEFVDKARKYVNGKARRNYVIFDAHTPTHGLVVDGVSILDFNSFPLRVKEVPDEPMKGILEMGYLDTLYGRSKGCITPSGWACESLPYLVEFDNFGISNHPGEAKGDYFVWGYDEISWFYLLSPSYKKEWLHYAYDWLRIHDKNGFLKMPCSRIVTLGDGRHGIIYRGFTPTEDCPLGMGMEETIKEIWNSDKSRMY